MTVIVGIKLTNRLDSSRDFQEVLSKYGCGIKTRIGLHNTCSNVCTNWGTILLEIIDEGIVSSLKEDLSNLHGIKVESMVL